VRVEMIIDLEKYRDRLINLYNKIAATMAVSKANIHMRGLNELVGSTYMLNLIQKPISKNMNDFAENEFELTLEALEESINSKLI
jgi:hypothetical protein